MSGDGAGNADSRTASTGSGGDASEGGAGGENPFGDGSGGAGDNAFGDGGSDSGQGGDEAFDQSLGEFDSVMHQEQDALDKAGAGAAADATGGDEGGVAKAEENGEEGAAGSTAAGSANSDGGSADVNIGPDAQTEARRVQGCDDADKVARQLCEAATQEADPFLRAALWDEYNEYKKILARQ